MAWTLHPQLALDGIALGDRRLCRVALMNDRRFPWLILVPMREGLREIFDLGAEDYRIVCEDMADLARRLRDATGAHKMNVAALGNQVPQLHIHIVARTPDDTAWPRPVWSAAGPAEPYASGELAARIENLKQALGL